MLTKLTIRNMKRFQSAEIELGNPVVFVGPNNSGKTTALQALALWDVGLKRWLERRRDDDADKKRKRPGVAINRRDLMAVPIPAANLLWKDLHVRDVRTIDGKQDTHNVCVEIIVEGVTQNESWTCGLEFDYANQESFYCRPLRLEEGRNPKRMEIPDQADAVNIAFLPPMSGLAANETRLDPGAINVRIGEGRTAEVLRNLCHDLVHGSHTYNWKDLCGRIKRLFGVELVEPRYLPERGEIEMSYREPSGVKLDLSCAGRGLQQTLLLLSYMYSNPGSVLLLDEPDAHLEILRQRQIYQLLTEVAEGTGGQIVAASHSEVWLNEAADRDVVVAFVGRPHRIDDRGSQLVKSLKTLGFENYYQAEQKGWVLYLEGSTDLAILYRFAERLGHPAERFLERPFVHYVGNQPQKARDHFHGLREAKPDLVGFALFDAIHRELQSSSDLQEYQWTRREIESYLCQPETLQAYVANEAHKSTPGPLFEKSQEDLWRLTMQVCIESYATPAALQNREDIWWSRTKVSEDFLDRVFEKFYTELGLPNPLRKTDYHVLAGFVPKDQLDAEIARVLDMIVRTAEQANPLTDSDTT